MKKYILITGAGQRLGMDIALYFAKNNENIIIHCNNSLKNAQDLGEKIVKNYKINTEIIQEDLSKADGGMRLIQKASKFGEISLIIHCASSIIEDNLLNLEIENVYTSINIHAISFLQMAEFIKKNNQNINMIAIIDANLKYRSAYLSYSIGKKILQDMVKFLAFHLKNQSRINGISPTWIENYNPLIHISEGKKILETLKLTEHLATTEQIINAIEFLQNNQSITGEIINIDSGSEV